VSQKAKRVGDLLAKIDPGYELPKDTSSSLLEFGLHCVLTRKLSQTASASTLKNLQQSYADWNELRVCQVQEISPHVVTKDFRLARAVAQDVKVYLQEIFQQNHGFDLEFLREDLTGGGKFLTQLTFLGMAASSDLLFVAADGKLPVTPGLVRVLDRLGLITRTTSVKKAREAIAPIVPKGQEREFLVRMGRVVDQWCDVRKPVCHRCPLLDGCPYGAKVFKEWEAQQKRLEIQRKRDEARLEAQRKKEEARRRREEERERKREEAEAKRIAREEARVKREKERARIADERKKAKDAAAKKKILDAKREAEAKKKAEAKAKIAAKKKAAADKKKAAAAKKKAALKKKAAKKAPAKKKAVKKKATKKVAKKKVTKKKVTKKKVAKKAPAKKKAAKKVTKKTGKKKVTKSRSKR